MSPQTIFPALRYQDAPAAIDWLERAFGFERHQVIEDPGGTIAHAELRLGDAMIMLGSVRPPGTPGFSEVAPPPGSASLYVVVEDPDALSARAAAAGAEIVAAPSDTDYGSRELTARDLEGNVWSFGTYQPWAEQA